MSYEVKVMRSAGPRPPLSTGTLTASGPRSPCTRTSALRARAIEDVRRVAWLFPLYLVLINIFVLPIAAAGLLKVHGARGEDRKSVV